MTNQLLQRPPFVSEAEWAEIVDALTRREFLTGGVALGALGLGLAACGSGHGQPTADSEESGWPVRIEGAFGQTVIPSRPKQIITIGQEPDLDAVAELGLVPVGAARDTSATSGIEPWTKARLGSRTPTLLNVTDAPPYEQIAALRPDLIVATTFYDLSTTHSQLSQIAPVLAYVTGPNTDTWQTTTTRVGRALGRQAQARQVIAQTEATIIRDRKAHPRFAGKTFTFGPVQANGEIYTTSSTKDLSAALLGQLGLVLSPKVTSLPASSTPGKSIISPEQLDLLDADVLILTYISDAAQKTLEANPLFQQLDAVKRGAYVAMPLTTAVAMAFPSAISVDYALGVAVPLLTKALR